MSTGFDSSFLDQVKSMKINLNQMIENPTSGIGTILIIMPLIIQQFSRMEKQKYFKDKKDADLPVHNEAFDFVIVGGGTAGSVLANRLSSRENSYKVLVLEAGGPPIGTSVIPLAGFFGIGVKETDWMYESTKQPRAYKGTTKQSGLLYQGKGLGGSSILSLLVHSRGTPKVYDDWASQVKDNRWSSQNLRKYFKRSENYKGKTPDADLHGCGGEFPIEPAPYQSPSFVLKAVKENNFTLKDITEAESGDYGRVESPIHGSVRYNAYSAFVEPVKNSRKNLKVLPFAEVTKIIFNSDNTKAIGVDYVFEGRSKRALANNEVIISAGALNSPKLLQISGIGPQGHLSSLNIPVVKDLPVGENLQDLAGTGVFGTYSKPKISFIPERDVGLETIVEEELQTKGPFSGNLMTANGYYSTKQNADPAVPDISHLHLYIGMSKALPPCVEKFFAMQKSMLDTIFDKSTLGKDGHFDLITLRSESRGSVKISSPDYQVPPAIDLGTFSHPSDLDRLIDGVRQVRAFYDNSKTFDSVGHQWVTKICSEFPDNSYEFLKCWVETLSLSGWAYSGTCKMGPDGDPTAVTDTSLRVHGVGNLRVVDASVIPVPPNSLPIPLVLAIAEQAADIIIKDAGGVPNAFSATCKDLPPPKLTVPKFVQRLLSEMAQTFTGI